MLYICTMYYYTLQKLNYYNLLVSIVARNSSNFNLVRHTGCYGYMHDVAMT